MTIILPAITGAGGGIGFALAKLCHTKGARVLIGDLKLTKEAEDYISTASSSDIVFEKCDVTSWDDLHNLISVSVERFGTVPDVYAPVVGQVLISELELNVDNRQAGIYEPSWSNFWDDEMDSYKTIRINVRGPAKALADISLYVSNTC